jgi:copper(I)-binding protein
MDIHPSLRRALRHGLAASLAALSFGAAAGQEVTVGDIAISRPFATVSLPGTTTGAAYIAALENTGAKPDKLLRATTPVAASVELHTMSVDAQGVMRMREIDGVVLAPKAPLRMRPGMGMHFMLVGLKRPLKEGETFPMSLQFERAGKVEVTFYVQTSRGQAAMADMPSH